MMLKYSVATLVLIAAIVLAVRWSGPPEPRRATAAVAERILQTVAREDYAAFIAEADRRMSKMRAEDFKLLAARHAPRLRQGHELRPLDERWRGDVHLSRWTVVFKDGGPNATLTVGLKDGRVATFAMY